MITGPRRIHYLEKHVEMVQLERELIETLLRPDEIYRNAVDPLIAVLLRIRDDGSAIRATVLTSIGQGYSNSLMSAWQMRRSDVDLMRRRRTLAWRWE